MISIRLRLALYLGLSSCTILLAGGWLLERSIASELRSRRDAALLSRAWAVANALQLHDEEIELDSVPALRAAFGSGEHLAMYQVWRADGGGELRSPNLAGVGLTRLSNAPSEPLFSTIELAGHGAGRAVNFTTRIQDEDDPSRAPEEVQIAVAEDAREFDATVAGLRARLVGVGALVILAELVCLAWALKRGLAPLDVLAARAAQLDERNLHLGLGREALPPELSLIRARLDELLARLRAAFEREERFNRAVAHELRTPVAELRASAEVALRRPAHAPTAGELSEVRSIALRMQSLIDVLLRLKRVESGAERAELEPTALDVLVQDTLEDHAALIRERALVLDLELPSAAVIETDRDMARAIVHNLVSNALEYAPRASHVRIWAVRERARFQLCVANLAPELVPADLERLFDPFWRKDEARGSSGHFGIGLSLARALAQALGCELTARLNREGELVFTLEGPARAVPSAP